MSISDQLRTIYLLLLQTCPFEVFLLHCHQTKAQFQYLYYFVYNQCNDSKSQTHQWHIRGAFNKFQDYVLNTRTVNHTFLTVMLLFNIFSLQFTAMFTLFYKSTGTRSIKFLLAPITSFTTCNTMYYLQLANLHSVVWPTN